MKPEERLLELPAGYAAILAGLKDQIRTARLKAGRLPILCCHA